MGAYFVFLIGTGISAAYLAEGEQWMMVGGTAKGLLLVIEVIGMLIVG